MTRQPSSKRPGPTRGRWLGGVLVALLLAAVASAMLVAARPATSATSKQRVTIEQTMLPGARTGTFVLRALSAGALERDAGTFAYRDGVEQSTIRGGQGVATYLLVTEFTGKRGTLFLRERLEFVAAGNGYTVGTGTWSVVHGTGAYAGLAGTGHRGYVLTARSVAYSQSEGLVGVLQN